MSKKQFVSVVLLSVLLSWVFTIFPGRFLAAKISTWPLLNKFKLLSPQAPIVITNRETVRVSDSGDLIQAAGQIKSKISSVVLISSNKDTVVGSAVNLTSDGSFVTAANSFSAKSGNYFVVLNDGRQAQITTTTPDPATSLVFFKVALDSVPAASLGNSKDLTPGEKILFAQSSLDNFSSKVFAGVVSSVQADISGQVFLSDYPRRSFGTTPPANPQSGEAVINTNAEVVGVWNGSGIISSDVLKKAAALYFNSQTKITRTSFGFSYSLINQTDSKLTGQPQGIFIKDVLVGSPAKQSGLASGDIITKIDNQAITESPPAEEILERYKPDDKLVLLVERKNQFLTISLTAGELK